MDLFHLPDDGRMKNRNILENNNKLKSSVWVLCVCADQTTKELLL